jgi:hypothetical protein
VTSQPPEFSARPPNPLPIETVRDLLGIVRALYALAREKRNHGHARELHGAGGRLRQALALAIRKGDSAAHAQAWRLADEAIATVARVQGSVADDLSSAVRLASERVQRRHFDGDHRQTRQARREARIKRG